MTFAAVAGVLLAASSNAPVAPTSGLEWTGLAFGAALVAGTSAFGRRGGITGGPSPRWRCSSSFIRYTDLKGWNISLAAFAGGAVALGLLVTRLVERFGRPRPVRAEEKSSWETEYARPTWTTTRRERSESWSSVLPAQPTGERTDIWDSSRWASSGR